MQLELQILSVARQNMSLFDARSLRLLYLAFQEVNTYETQLIHLYLELVFLEMSRPRV